MAILGINGEISNIAYSPPSAPCNNSEDTDLTEMARWAMHYLANSPKPEYNYQPIFQVFPLKFPSVRECDDPVVDCDTDARMDWEWFYMRDIAGGDFAADIEAKFHERIRGYINEQGLALAHAGCYHENLNDAVYGEADRIIHVWGTIKILRSLCEDYKRTHNPERLHLAGRVVSGLRGLFVWVNDSDGESCYAPNGMGPVAVNPGQDAKSYWNCQPAPVVGPLLDYYKISGDPQALSFSKAAALGVMKNKMPGCVCFSGDGSFVLPQAADLKHATLDKNSCAGHTHASLHVVWGIAELGLFTGEKQYISFAKKVFDWMITRGTGTGWFPAMPDNCNETCAISDMISIAMILGRSGYPEYFDYAERFFRNYIVNLQFILTPEIENYYRRIHAKHPKEEVDRQLGLLAKVQGAIIGGSGINDYENALLGGVSGFSLFGCCAPEGMRAIYSMYSHGAADEDSIFLENGYYVHTHLNLDNENVVVKSHTPSGGVTVTAKKDLKLFIRLPHWTDYKTAESYINGEPAQLPQFANSPYIYYHAQPGDVLSVRWAVVTFSHVSQVWRITAPELRVVFDWRANMVLGCEPMAAEGNIPIFTGKPRVIPKYDKSIAAQK